MDLSIPPASRFVRILAIVSLLLGLNDAARLLGVAQGPVSPLTSLGAAGFTFLAVFCLARLFAAVGLWMKASWGAVLLVTATGFELAMFLTGSRDVQMNAIGFAIRIVLVAGVLVLMWLSWRVQRANVHD